MKVLITNFHPGDGGGHTTYIESLVRGASDSVDFTIAAPPESKLASIAKTLPCRYVAIDFPGKLREFKGILESRRKLVKLMNESFFDIIHVNGSPDHRLIMYSLVGRIFGIHRPKIVYTKHNSFGIKQGFFTGIRYRHFCDAVIVVCKMLKNDWMLFMPSNSVRVVGNGVDLDRFKPGGDLPGVELRGKLGLPKDSIVFISCAGTAEHKGWHLLANALRGLDGVYLLLLGHEPSQGKLEQLFINDSIPENLIFLGQQSDVVPFLQGGNVGFVLSTGVETISFACREMMACGLPVLVSDFGCLKDNVTPSTGWVTRAGSLDSLKEAVSKILQSDIERMGIYARERAVNEFGVSTFITKTVGVYKQSIER